MPAAPGARLLAALAVVAAPLLAGADGPTSVVARLEREADASLDRMVGGRGFSGVILVARDGKPLLRKAYGFADWVLRVPNEPETRFMIFSSTKQLTAAAVLRLADRGKLSVQDPVAHHLEHWPQAWASVRLHHLLSHTSGIDVDTLAFWLFRFHPRYWPGAGVEPPAYVPGPLLNEPGATFRYANVGYTVLSLVLERVLGRPFPQIIHDEVFAPLGMRRSDLEGAPGAAPRARGHNPPGGEPRYAEQATVDVVGSGDAVTTVDDLLKWDEALYGSDFLSAAAAKAMFTPHSRGDLGDYGYGWIVERTVDGKPRFRHHGVGAGFRSFLFRRPDLHLYVAVLMNREYEKVVPEVLAMERRLEEILSGP